MANDLAIDAHIAGIHAQGKQFVLAVTGGGSGAIGRLLAVPGGSGTLLEAIVPYSAESLADFLHARPEHFCSAATARSMAMAAFTRARQLQQPASSSGGQRSASGTNTLPIGLGCTASLASDRPKRGPHRIHVAWQSAAATVTYSLELVKGQRSRREEEEIASLLVLDALAEAVGLSSSFELRLSEMENVVSERTDAPRAWQELLLGSTPAVRQTVSSSGEVRLQSIEDAVRLESPRVIFPGAFNPLHAGHLRMAEIAAKRLEVPVEFELSIQNVDKPPLDYTEMRLRGAPFVEQRLPLWFTRAPTFEKKSGLFPGATFIVGADTIERIGHAKYYGHSSDTAEGAIAKIRERGCRFLVFGRVRQEEFQTLSQLQVPKSLRDLCDEVAAAEFREDVSATQLRQAARDSADD